MYATLADLIERAGQDEILQVADRDLDGTPDASVITQALEDAQSTIDGYVRVRYSLPLASVPAQVTAWAISIARYHLHREGQPDYVVRDYTIAIQQLKDLSRGLIRLDQGDGSGAEAALSGNTIGQISGAGDEEYFSSEKMDGFL